MTLVRALIDTPVGVMRALASETALFAFEFSRDNRMARLDARLSRWLAGATILDGSNAVIDLARDWATRYFAGERADSLALPLDMRGAPFEQQVWAELRRIPPGTTTTYGAVARAIGHPAASRAVGMANGANPIAIIVPCHRVIGANGTLTGYGGGLERKTWLLDHERKYWGTADGSRLPFG
jgi:O-6-methylguanine DNA methyltransferase